jgi:hypothetical protein
MNRITLSEQNHLLQNRERIRALLQQYPHVINVGVGLKETGDELTSTLCYRVYVEDKKPPAGLQPHEIIPPLIDGFITDVIPYGIVEEAIDKDHYRPLLGGIPIKNAGYTDNETRGGGTLGCLAVLDDGSDKIVALTNEHVVRLNTQVAATTGIEIGQPWKIVCCCCCTKNVIGKVLKAVKKPDCAIIELDQDIINEILAGNKLDEILDIGRIRGKAVAIAGTKVQKMGAATGFTEGIIKEVAFDDDQILIEHIEGNKRFAGFGDSGSVILTNDKRVVGLLWGTERNRFKSHTPGVPGEPTTDLEFSLRRRLNGVAAPIESVERALGIRVYTPPAVATISIHPDDTKTHAVPSILPASANPKQHFVTAKGEGDIILKVTFEEPVDNSRIKWVSNNDNIIFPAIGTDNTTARMSRDTSEGMQSVVRVQVDDMDVSKEVFVWVVWSKGANFSLQEPMGPEQGPYITVNPTDIVLDSRFLVDFIISPASIIPKNMAVEDVPDLRGPNQTAPPNVDDTDSGVYNQGVDLSGGAKFKWDVSRRMRRKVINTGFFPPQDEYNKNFLH